MNPEVTKTMITVCGTLLTAFVSLLVQFFRERKKHREEKEEFLPTGMAVGYYYNFIKPILEELKVAGQLEVSISKKGSNDEEFRHAFPSGKVQIRILIPTELTEQKLDEADDFAAQFRKGNILRKGSKRNFAIRLSIDDAENLVIQDVARPLNAVRKYIENLPSFKEDSQERRDRLKSETANFTKSIGTWVDKEGFPRSKISFQPL